RRHTRFSRDWSSDVCSSDLWLGEKMLPDMHVQAGKPTLLQRFSGFLARLRFRSLTRSRGRAEVGQRREAAPDDVATGLPPPQPEIGRASCRERVQNTVVGGS